MHINSLHAKVYVGYARGLIRRPASPALQCTFWRFIGASTSQAADLIMIMSNVMNNHTPNWPSGGPC